MDELNFAASRTCQLAVLYEIAVLGEAVKRLSPDFRSRHQKIPWKEIAGMRDKAEVLNVDGKTLQSKR